jgi:hypothetical protein
MTSSPNSRGIALILVALVAVPLALYGPRWWRARETNRTTAAARASAKTNAPPQTAALARTTSVPEERIDQEQARKRFPSWVEAPQRDPFMAYRLATSVARTNRLPASEVLSLNAIWRQSSSSLVVINKAVYGEGDTAEGYHIDRIEGDRVLLTGPNGTESIEFRAPGVVLPNPDPDTAATNALSAR